MTLEWRTGLAVAAIVGAFFFLSLKERPTQVDDGAPTDPAQESVRASVEEDPGEDSTLSRTPLSRNTEPVEATTALDRPGILDGLHDPGASPEQDVAIVANALEAYRSVFQRFPDGDNEEIVAALAGSNQRSISWIRPGEAPLNEGGGLVDRWGSAYYFHRLSGEVIEVRSAGPDRLMWTEDDASSVGAEELAIQVDPSASPSASDVGGALEETAISVR